VTTLPSGQHDGVEFLITFSLTDEQRHVVVSALAKLAAERVDLCEALGQIAVQMGSAILFEQLRALHVGMGVGLPSAPSEHDLEHVGTALAGGTNFTAEILRLVAKSDPGNRARMKVAFRREVEAFERWERTPLDSERGSPCPT
jgi:hypothetical protein